MAARRKITTGLNDRPLDETIGQTGGGLPDDSGRSLETDEEQVERARESLSGEPGQPEHTSPPGTEGTPETVPEGTPGAGENICRRCAGSGKVDGSTCPDCGGTGKVVTPLGSA